MKLNSPRSEGNEGKKCWKIKEKTTRMKKRKSRLDFLFSWYLNWRRGVLIKCEATRLRGVTCHATTMLFYFPRTICNRSSPACVLSSYQQYLLWSNAALANGHQAITDKCSDLHKFTINAAGDVFVSHRENVSRANLWKLIIMIIFAFFYVLQWNVLWSEFVLRKTFKLQIESKKMFAPSSRHSQWPEPRKYLLIKDNYGF